LPCEHSFTVSKIAWLSWVSSPCPLELPGYCRLSPF